MNKTIELQPGNYKAAMILHSNPVTSFVKRLIHQRSFLIKKHLGRCGDDMVLTHGRLLKEISMVTHFNETGWCKWFMRSDIREMILFIMPGISNKCHKKFMNEFESLPKYCATVIAKSLNNQSIN